MIICRTGEKKISKIKGHPYGGTDTDMMQLLHMKWVGRLVLSLLCLVLEQPTIYTHAAVVWMVPNSNYIRIWREWRNPACSLGSVWRPSLEKVDPGDGKHRPVILLGDIFDAGSGPPNFPTTLLVYDDTLKVKI
jgi:hypothetical protein